MDDDREYLPLSWLSQAAYCLRRAALLMNERVWVENADTAKGRAEHERVHTQRIERRGTQIKLYEYEVFSQALGLRGKCDCIEATACDSGCSIPAVSFPVSLFPVEYKHGSVRDEFEYKLQLCAQAMCLEEMLDCTITQGALYYGEIKHRVNIQITEGIKQNVKDMFDEMHQYYERGYTPKAKKKKACYVCSLKDLCLPELEKTGNVETYMNNILAEELEDNT